MTPPVLLVFLGLTVGDMSIGGVGTATFRHEAQVDNVLEPVLITGNENWSPAQKRRSRPVCIRAGRARPVGERKRSRSTQRGPIFAHKCPPFQMLLRLALGTIAAVVSSLQPVKNTRTGTGEPPASKIISRSTKRAPWVEGRLRRVHRLDSLCRSGISCWKPQLPGVLLP